MKLFSKKHIIMFIKEDTTNDRYKQKMFETQKVRRSIVQIDIRNCVFALQNGCTALMLAPILKCHPCLVLSGLILSLNKSRRNTNNILD